MSRFLCGGCVGAGIWWWWQCVCVWGGGWEVCLKQRPSTLFLCFKSKCSKNTSCLLYFCTSTYVLDDEIQQIAQPNFIKPWTSMMFATHLVDYFKWKKLMNFSNQMKPYCLPKVASVIIDEFRQWLNRFKPKP